MKLLINTHPLLVLKELAEQLGLNEAIFLQQLQYWLNSGSAHFLDGKWWIYNTYKDWREDNFPFWSEKTIQRIVKSLREKELITTTDKYNNWSQDHTLWYTINYEKLKIYEEESNKLQEKRRKKKDEKKKIKEERKITRKIFTLKKKMAQSNKIELGQNDQTLQSSKIELGQNDSIAKANCLNRKNKMTQAIPEITTEITTEITNNNNTKILEEEITSHDLKNIIEKIEDKVKGKVNLKIFKNTMKKNNIQIKDIKFYLDNWNKFDYKTKDDPVAFFLHCIITKRPIPIIQNGKNAYSKPDQSYNFEQRPFDADFPYYDNF